MADVVQDWVEQTVVFRGWQTQSSAAMPEWRRARKRHPLPPHVAFVFCQQGACVVGKEGASQLTGVSDDFMSGPRCRRSGSKASSMA